MTTKPRIAVKPGQVWADTDKRGYGRRVRIVELDGVRHAVVEPVLGGRRSRILYDQHGLLRYRLVTDVQAPVPADVAEVPEVPEVWLQAAFDAIGRSETSDGDEQMRYVLAAVLPLAKEQVREDIAAELEQQAYKEAMRDVNGTECTEAKTLFTAARMVRGGGTDV